jgi:peptide deformylase
VRAQTPKGKRIQVEGEGLLARALQHEIDHLDGILYIDRVEKPEDIRALEPEERWDRAPEAEQAPR